MNMQDKEIRAQARARYEHCEDMGNTHIDCVEIAELYEMLDYIEQLESYIKSLGNAGGCQCCTRDSERPYGRPCDNCGYDLCGWNFDQARFSDKPTTGQEGE